MLRQQPIEITQLAVDTHGSTDMGMALSRTSGFDLCPRLKSLDERRLFLPRGCEVPENLKAICNATLDLSKTSDHWDEFVHLTASMYSGHTSCRPHINGLQPLATGIADHDSLLEWAFVTLTHFLPPSVSSTASPVMHPFRDVEQHPWIETEEREALAAEMRAHRCDIGAYLARNSI